MVLVYTYQVVPIQTKPTVSLNHLYVYGRAQPIKHWRKQYDTDACRVVTEVIKQPTCNLKTPEGCVGTSVVRRVKSNLSKTYYASTHHYLQSRTKTHTQNATLGASLKDYTFESTYDASACVVYKPSNTTFQTQGGVSASLTTFNQRNKAITKNSASFRDPYKLSGSNFGLHHGHSPYFLKSKENQCPSCVYIGRVTPIVRL